MSESQRTGDAAMSELPNCEISTDFTKSGAQTVITVENSPPIMALAWVNFLKQRLQLLHVDYKHVTADRIVVASRPEVADSVAQLLRSAAESADQYVTAARGNDSARKNELGERAAQFGEP